ncbi:MAG: DUF1573 domain-containing protein, partial [Planctomycetaceae bacterium]|nr:DUF1573 domain-containing protein [Planctomycetaceae bacterium]
MPPSFIAFLDSGKVSDCDCCQYTASLGLAALGACPYGDPTITKDTVSLRSNFDEASRTGGGDFKVVTIIDEMFRGFVPPSVDQKLRFVLVHGNGHVFGLLGSLEVNGKLYYQMIHGHESPIILATESQIRAAGFGEVWFLSSESAGFPIPIGDGRLWLDRLYYNFGQIRTEDNQGCIFTLTNRGKSNIVLRKIMPSCSCASTNVNEDEKILSGKTKVIKITLKPSPFLYTRQDIALKCVEEGTG